MLTANDLAFDYPEKSVFKRINFKLDEGQLLHIRGPNGVGKTTLLKLLAGLLLPSQGCIHYEGQSIYHNTDYPKKRCFVGYRNAINPWLTVRENCLFDPSWGRYELTVETLLNDFNLSELADIPCHQLSSGQKRRVGLLRLSMTPAKLWLCDEPFVALDREAVQLISSRFKAHLKAGGQIVLAAHGKMPEDWSHFIQPFDLLN